MKYTIVHTISLVAPNTNWSMMGDDYETLQWLSDPALKPSLEALEEKAAELNAAEPMRLLRIERDRRLAEVDWMVIKAYSQNCLHICRHFVICLIQPTLCWIAVMNLI